MPPSQLSLFSAQADLPERMHYQSDIISEAEEENLARFIASLPLKPFEFAGGLACMDCLIVFTAY